MYMLSTPLSIDDLFIKKGLFRKISFLGRYNYMGDHK